MRRSLVLGDESAHHPFLQSLPPHVRMGQPVACRPAADSSDEAQSLVRAQAADWLKRHAHAAPHTLVARARHWRKGLRLSMQDARDFLLAYCACFVAVMAFIA